MRALVGRRGAQFQIGASHQPERARQFAPVLVPSSLANEIVNELLLVSEERQAQKIPVNDEQMCKECPELLAEFTKQRTRLDHRTLWY